MKTIKEMKRLTMKHPRTSPVKLGFSKEELKKLGRHRRKILK